MILMDVHMPVMDGLEATRRIKADSARTRKRHRRSDGQRHGRRPSSSDSERRRRFPGEALPRGRTAGEDPRPPKRRLRLRGQQRSRSPTRRRNPALSTALGQLPLELVEELRNATLNGNKRLLDKLILRVREAGDAASAHALQELADKYEYDALTRMLEEACQR